MWRGDIEDMTDRQLKIAAYIYNHPQGVTGGHIADVFSISLRTVQNEIAELNRILDKNHQILSKHQGYYIESFSDTDREYIARELKDRVSIIMPIDKVMEMMIFLMFEKDYISMERLAGKMHVSKSNVFTIFQNSKVLKRCTQVSKTKGMRINLSEKSIRNELSKIYNPETCAKIDESINADYDSLYHLISDKVNSVLSEKDKSVSGEELWHFKRHIVCCAIRTKRGFCLEAHEGEYLAHSFIVEIAESIQTETGISLNKEDIDDCSATLNSLSSFSQLSFSVETETKFNSFIEILNRKYGLSLRFGALARAQFIDHIEKLMIRLRNDQYNINFKKREINRRYPMATHLILEVFERTFDIELPDTEVTLLALYLAREIYKDERKVRCVIVTEISPSVVYYLRDELVNKFSEVFTDVEIMTDYQFLSNPMEHQDTLYLTTSQPVSILYDDLLLINPFLGKTDVNRIKEKATTKIGNLEKEKLLESEQKYLSQVIVVEKEFHSLKSFLETYQLSVPDRSYEFVTDIPVLLYPSISDEKSHIDVYRLSRAFTYRNKRVKTIIFSYYNPADRNIINFYDYLRNLMNR